MSDIVDRHYVVFSNETFTGLSKNKTPRDFYARVEEKYHDKLELIWLDSLPGVSAWEKEYYSRNAFLNHLKGLEVDDLVIMSDVDELIRPEVIGQLKSSKLESIIYFGLDTFNFKFNYKLMHGLDAVWAGPVLLPFGLITTPQDLRNHRWDNILSGENFVYNAGWHFSYLTSGDDVKAKLESYSHQEHDIQVNKNARVSLMIQQRRGFHSHLRPGEVWAVVDINDLKSNELVREISRFPGMLVRGDPDDTGGVNLAIRKSKNRAFREEREKIARGLSGIEIAKELTRRVRRRVLF